MKEVVAIIQMKKMEETKNALDTVGFPAFTAYKAQGRGKQRGLEIVYPSDLEELREGSVKFLPKRMISVVVEDEFVPAVVAVITRVNRTGNIGDGRIFVSPIEESVRIRTGERGSEAVS
ncbi:P-II family nitrogen regulator [Methanotrichaceae archaeon M04Ac]|jgi:nitrogen regulatory protein PII 2|uniref:P-II family nitrogen regulator n=1 Tax=Candidatus Methanocrinis alkalitolerans TaxID=3033395 RepID=A0ABT5XF02_9EURY|nr:P-II family nitrogen regulator [Candidatus Methanocrinis alkalitolerans]MCR3883340.1 P-II family nitrogen regulator [Methanothrix sp.]MDF0593218.1 P-II family nitrogen regulator [Candidatus Methanocrinis alkalitolerans]